MLRVVSLALVLLLAAAADAPFGPTSAHTPTSKVTWGQDVQPILARRCFGCHRPGGTASTAIETYAEAKSVAAAVRREVLAGTMPPWPAAPGIADYSNDQRLTEIETSVLVGWTSGGAPLGAPVRTAVPRVRREPGVRLTASRSASQDRFVFLTSDANDRWIAAWRFDPGAESGIVSATLTVDGAPLGRWGPTDGVVSLPRTVTVRLLRSASILVDVERGKSSGQSGRSSTPPSLELFWGKRSEEELAERVFPCGDADLNANVEVVGLRPEALRVGASVVVSAMQPNGAVIPLALIPRYMPLYRPMLRLRKPVSISAGGRLRIASNVEGCRVTFELAERR